MGKRRLESERLFLETGCLLELHDRLTDIDTKDGMASVMPRSVNYFGLDTKNDFPMPDLLEGFWRKFEREGQDEINQESCRRWDALRCESGGGLLLLKAEEF